MNTKKMAENMRNTVGLPVGVQVVTKPFEEEKCLNIMNLIDGEIQFYKKNKFPIWLWEKERDLFVILWQFYIYKY